MIDKTSSEKILERFGNLPPTEYLSGDDRKFFSNITSALLTTHLEHLIKEKMWVIGVIMSASMLEFTGKIRLIWKYKGSISKRKINNLNFATIIVCLLTSKIIDKSKYKKMEKIRDARNKLAHNVVSQVFSTLSKKPNPTLENLITEATEIIKGLFHISYI